MNKLELKHLAPYLPYGLGWDLSGTNYGEMEKERLTECKLLSISFSELHTPILVKTNILAHNQGLLSLLLSSGKPILRPLSDITLEQADHCGYKTIASFIYDIKGETIPVSLWYAFIKKHFDVFGLIEKGLAIDINTLKP